MLQLLPHRTIKKDPGWGLLARLTALNEVV
jgi:hypothetical protein